MTEINIRDVIQVILATAHPAKFAAAVDDTLHDQGNFDFNRDVLPKEFEGLLLKERRVLAIPKTDLNLIKAAIEQGLKEERKI